MVIPSLPASRELLIARRAELSCGNVAGWTLKAELSVHHLQLRLKCVATARALLISHLTTDFIQ